MRIEIAVPAGGVENIGVAIVRVTVFEAARHAVGECLLDTSADRPAMGRILVLHAGIDIFKLGPGKGPAARRIDERAVERITETGADRAAPVRLRLIGRTAGREAVIVEVVFDVGFDTVDPTVVEEVVAGIGPQGETAEVLVDNGRRAVRIGIGSGIAGVHTDIEATPVVDAGGLGDRRFHRRFGNGYVGRNGRERAGNEENAGCAEDHGFHLMVLPTR
jgi:hypothetical protein